MTFSYKKGDDAYTVIGRAIRNYFQGDYEKISVFHARQMAEIIANGFLDDIVSQTTELVDQNRKTLNAIEADIREMSSRKLGLETQVTHLNNNIKKLEESKRRLEDSIMAYDGKTVTETDIALAGAKKAYIFIYEKTRNKELAAKAFNSYLIGGRYQPGDTFCEEPIDAKGIIWRDGAREIRV